MEHLGYISYKMAVSIGRTCLLGKCLELTKRTHYSKALGENPRQITQILLGTFKPQGPGPFWIFDAANEESNLMQMVP